MKKRIMILGAGVYQVPLIKKAKEMGLETVVFSPKGVSGSPLWSFCWILRHGTCLYCLILAAVSEQTSEECDGR